MEALNSAPLGAMGSLIKKLDKLMEAENWVPNIRQLREDVSTISTKLVKLSEVHDPPLTVNYWMKEARELSYDMEDCVDQFVHAGSPVTKIAWIDEISGFRTRVEEVIERYHRFKLQYVIDRSAVTNAVASHRIGMAFRDLNTVTSVGMEGPKNELVRWLKPTMDDENELQVKVVSILGVEGIGKSTLGQELWHILGQEFECQAFVQLSKKPDMRMILRSILLQVRPHQPPEACHVPNLIHKISKHLQDKRYFIIIDDVWAVSVWETISRAFPEGNCSSRIITTTTIEDVALACCSYDPEHIFKMRSLSFHHSKELFFRTVFGSGKECPQQFHDVSDEITRKCGGLPLAITCIASLLANQPEIVHKWEYVQNFLRDNLRANPTSVEILKQVLNLCYNSLPHCLKTCLLYLSIYPENYIILKEDLVKQWMAEGFICATEEKDIAKVASSYFDEMVSLGLIQRMNISCNKKRVPYVVHPLVLEFIKCLSTEDNFITVIDYSQSTIALAEKIRRLSLQFRSATYATTPASIGQWQIRSLSFIGLLNCMPALKDFKLVRVIILNVLVDNGDTSFPLTGIHGLLLLRYLQVRCNVTVELPNQIGCLKHLETLEIHAEVTAVPEDIVYLPRLLHLRLGRKIYLNHKHPIKNNLPSGKALYLDDSSRASSHPVLLMSGLLDMIPRPPKWIAHFCNLRYLDAVVREFQTYDINILSDLWALTILLLYVRTSRAGNIQFKTQSFPTLKYFRFMCGGVMLLTFDKEAMPKLRRLNIGFNAQKGGKYENMVAGIQHLLNIQEIAASIGAASGADESDRRAAESTFKDAISKHPCRPSFKVKRFDQVDGEYNPSEENWIQEIESSNQSDEALNEQHWAPREDQSYDQPAVIGNLPGEDMTKHADTSDELPQTQAAEKLLAKQAFRYGPLNNQIIALIIASTVAATMLTLTCMVTLNYVDSTYTSLITEDIMKPTVMFFMINLFVILIFLNTARN
ncbi:unnamed protein product [Urochloa humidicola]